MAFTDTSKTNYKKIILVRVQHSHFDPNPTSVGGGIYTYEVERPVFRVARNGVDLVQVTSTPTVDDTFFYDETTKVLTLKLASAPNDTTNVVTIYTYLFYTNERTRALPESPDAAQSSSNPLRDWEPKVSSVPIFRQSIRNNLSGILTTSASSLSIINTDNALNPLLGENQSFANKLVDIWLALDDVSSIDKVYTGVITGATVDDLIFTLSLTDSTSKLDAAAWMGDLEEEAYHLVDDNPTLDPQSNQVVNRFYIGKSSRFTRVLDPTITGTTGYRPVFDSLETAINVNYSDTVSGTTNREWNLGRSFNGLEEVSATFNSISGGGLGSDYVEFTPTISPAGEFRVGQAVLVAGSIEERVINVVGSVVTITWDSGTATPLTTDTVVGAKATIFIRGVNLDGSVTYVGYNDVTLTETATAGGNVNSKITFDDNFEAGIADFGGNSLSPLIHNIGFILSLPTQNEADSPIDHGDVLKKILERANIVGGVNLPSFLDITALDTELQFSMPYFDEIDYDPYRDYVERLLLTTNGLLYTQADQVIYDEIELPTTQLDKITTDESLRGSRRMSVDFRDIAHITTGFNPHSDVTESGTSSSKHRYLHESDKSTRFRHLAIELNSSVLTLRSKINRNRKIEYRYRAFALGLDLVPGDNITLQHDVTTDGTVNTFITEISKSLRDVDITVTDILDD